MPVKPSNPFVPGKTTDQAVTSGNNVFQESFILKEGDKRKISLVLKKENWLQCLKNYIP